MLRNATQYRGFPIAKYTRGSIAMLCPSISTFRQIILMICTNRGMGNCLMIASAAINPVQPSVTTVEKNPQSIIPAARNGRYSLMGVLNI